MDKIEKAKRKEIYDKVVELESMYKVFESMISASKAKGIKSSDIQNVIKRLYSDGII